MGMKINKMDSFTVFVQHEFHIVTRMQNSIKKRRNIAFKRQRFVFD